MANLVYFSHGDSTAESVSNTSFGKTVLLYQTPAEREHAYQTTYASAVGRQHENAAEDLIPPAIRMYTAEELRKRRILAGTVTLTEKPLYDRIKRIGDVVCSAGALIVLSPLLIGTAAASIVNDFGSPIYSQMRVGKDGKEFRIYKFRSMYKDADARREALMAQNESKGATFKMKDDPRITSVGHFLRKTSIDELPQLFNILKGDMSVIGPRPFIPEEQAALPADRLLVKPGLSCYWQVGGKNELDEEAQIELDRKYVRERSVATDIKLIFMTIRHVLGGKNS